MKRIGYFKISNNMKDSALLLLFMM